MHIHILVAPVLGLKSTFVPFGPCGWEIEGKIGLPECIEDHGEKHKLPQQRHHQRRRWNDFRQQQEEHSQREQDGYA